MATLVPDKILAEIHRRESFSVPLGEWRSYPLEDRLFPESKSRDTLFAACRKLPLSFALGTYIAGGAVTRALMGTDESEDIDVFTSNGQFRAALAEKLGVTFGTPKTTSAYFDAECYQIGDQSYQLCVVGGFPTATLGSFPTPHVMVAPDGTYLLAHEHAIRDILARETTLTEDKQRWPDRVLQFWVDKWRKRGFTILPEGLAHRA